MALRAFESHPAESLKDILFLADTSFVLDTILKGHLSPAYKFLQAHQKTNFFGINVVIKLEVLRKIRMILINDHIKATDLALYKKLPKMPGERTKFLIKSGHQNIMKDALRGKIQPYMNAIERDFEYVKGSHEAGLFMWEDVVKVMESYLMDSSDALILNFAIKMDFDAVATCDGDFTLAESDPALDIYVPESMI